MQIARFTIRKQAKKAVTTAVMTDSKHYGYDKNILSFNPAAQRLMQNDRSQRHKIDRE